MVGVSTEFLNTKDEVTPALKKQREEYERGKKAAEGLEAANRRNEQAALSAVNKSLQGQDRLQAVIRGTEALKKRGVLTDQEAARAQQFIREQTDGTAQKRREAERAAKAEQKAVEAIANRQNRVTIETKRAVQARKQGLLTAQQLKNELQRIHNVQSGTVRQSGQMLANVRSTLTTYIGLHAAISTATRLIQKQREIEERGAEEQLTVGQAQRLAIVNTKGQTEDERRQFFDAIDAIDAPTFSRAELFTAAARAISATSEGPRGFRGRIEDTVSAIQGATELLPEKEALTDIAQAFIGFQKATEGTLTRDEANNLLQRTIGQARITEPSQIRNLIPAFQNLRTEAERGGRQISREDIFSGAAFIAQLSSGIEDATGELTRTASGLFFKTINEQVPDSLARGFAEELAAVQEDDATATRLRELLRNNLQGRGIAKGSIEQIFSRTGFGAGFENIREALQRTGGPDDLTLLRTFTPELRRTFGVEAAEASAADVQAVRFGPAGIALKQAESALATQNAATQFFEGYLQFLPDRLIRGNQAAAESLLADLIRREELQGNEEVVNTLRNIFDELQLQRKSAAQPQQTVTLPETGE